MYTDNMDPWGCMSAGAAAEMPMMNMCPGNNVSQNIAPLSADARMKSRQAVAPTLPPVQEPVAPLPPYDGGYPVPPTLPPVQEPVAPLPPNGGYPVPPILPPVQEPVAPLPPSAEIPPMDPGQIPVIPLPPIVEEPGQSPVYPGTPNPGYCTVRFLNSAVGYSVGIRISSLLVCSGLSFGELTNYNLIPDGFRTVRLTDENSPSTLYLQKSVPFRAGDVITLVIVRTATGLDLVQVSDAPCVNRPTGTACIRMANMSFDAPGLDLILDGSKLVFTDVLYKEVSMFKQARPKRYVFTIASTVHIPTPYDSDIETIDEVPQLVPAYILGVRPAVTFSLTARAGLMYTIYVIGSWNRPRIKIVVNQA